MSIPEPPKMKVCTSCHKTLPANTQFFHVDRKKKDRLKHQCKTCVRRYTAAYIPVRKRPGYMKEIDEFARLYNEQLAEQQIKESIRLAVKNAPYATADIVVDGKKIDIKIKVCSKCSVQKPATLDYFHKCEPNKDGLNGRCKVCIAKYTASRK